MVNYRYCLCLRAMERAYLGPQQQIPIWVNEQLVPYHHYRSLALGLYGKSRGDRHGFNDSRHWLK